MNSPPSLRALARLYGIQTSYRNMRWEVTPAAPESLLAALRCLGASAESLEDVHGALIERVRGLWGRAVPPVIVAWGGEVEFDVRLPLRHAEGAAEFVLRLENGEESAWREDLSQIPARRGIEADGARYVSKRLRFHEALPFGYHRLSVDVSGGAHEAFVIASPHRAYGFPEGPEGRAWGVFVPLYALRSSHNWGAGDFSDLENLTAWTRASGGSVVGTLPLLAAFLERPFEPSPYNPASRLFWNEFYLDVARAPEFEASPEAKAVAGNAALEIEVLRASPRVDYAGLMSVKRRVLDAMARSLFASNSPRLSALRAYVASHPQLEDYARFRATAEKQGVFWDEWPDPLRSGALEPGDYDEDAARYHQYVQWLAEEQLGGLAEKARAAGAGLYLDLPLGSHRYGYDTWREREFFVLDASAGAPPDIIFTGGQDWGLAPMHPEVSRLQGYRYTLAYIRQHMRHAGVLRIDHVMGLHRLYWIPKGVPASEGVYVRYPEDELAAILCLESHRNRCAVVGENLGTVPWAVEKMLRTRGLNRMYVLQYALEPGPHGEPMAIEPDTMASINTHDMVPFEGFRRGLDIDDRRDLGLLGAEEQREERERRETMVRALSGFLERQGHLTPGDDPAGLLRAVLLHLAESPARVLLATLEDLWFETEPQNVPGTWKERPNWVRKARLSLEEFREDPFVTAVLKEIDRVRRTG